MMWDEQMICDPNTGGSDFGPRNTPYPAEPAEPAEPAASAAPAAGGSASEGPAAGGLASGGIADFETAMAELEQTVRRLESGEAGLAEAMALFQKGTALSAACDRYLTQAETVINQLVEQPNGTFKTVPFVPEAAPGSGSGIARPGDES